MDDGLWWTFSITYFRPAVDLTCTNDLGKATCQRKIFMEGDFHLSSFVCRRKTVCHARVDNNVHHNGGKVQPTYTDILTFLCPLAQDTWFHSGQDCNKLAQCGICNFTFQIAKQWRHQTAKSCSACKLLGRATNVKLIFFIVKLTVEPKMNC